MEEQTFYVRDVEAVRRLLERPPAAWIWTHSGSGGGSRQMEDQLAWAVQRAEQGKRFTAIIGEAGPPVYQYLMVRLVDMPHLAVAVYDRLVGWK
jgi:hypothetical protein